MIYIDTSVLGAIFFREPGAADLVTRLEPPRQARLMISAWTLTEMASIGGIKQRTGAIDVSTRQQALAIRKMMCRVSTTALQGRLRGCSSNIPAAWASRVSSATERTWSLVVMAVR